MGKKRDVAQESRCQRKDNWIGISYGLDNELRLDREARVSRETQRNGTAVDRSEIFVWRDTVKDWYVKDASTGLSNL